MGRLALSFVASACLALVSCGSSSKPSTQAADKSKDWYAALVDDAVDTQLRVRPNDLAADSFAGPLAARAHQEADAHVDDPAGAAFVKAVDKSDVIVVAVRKLEPDADAVVVVGGVPASSTPDSMVDPSSKPFWTKTTSPVAGVDEWELAGDSPDHRKATLAILPGPTWVLATGGAIARMNAAFVGGTPSAYAPAAAGGGKNLMEALVVGQALEHAKADVPDGVNSLVAPITKAAFHFDGGDSPGAHGTLSFTDDGAAGKVESALKIMAARTPALRVIGNLAIVRSGSDVTVDVPISAMMRDLILSQAASNRDSDAPSEHHREIDPGKKKKGH